MIQHILEQANQEFFFSHFLRLDLLKNCPQVIPTLAQWLYEKWHPYDISLTKEKLIYSFTTRLNDDRIPITFVALKNDKPVGVISLKKETAPEFSDFSKNLVWMGSLHVPPEERKQGLGQELLKCAATIAGSLGYEKLYFYTSNRTNVKWYLKRGAQVVEERPFRNHTVTIMYISLKDAAKNVEQNLEISPTKK